MKKRLIRTIAIVVAVVLIICSLSACGSIESKLVGQWRYSEGSGSEFDEIEFFSDGTYVSSDPNYYGSYSLDGDRIRLEGFLVEQLTYTIKVSGDTLTLGKIIYTKK